MPARIEALGALAGLGRAAVHAQLVGALHVVLHLTRRGARRRLTQVGVVRRAEHGVMGGVEGGVVGGVEVVPALVRDGGGASPDTERAAGWPVLQRMLRERG